MDIPRRYHKPFAVLLCTVMVAPVIAGLVVWMLGGFAAGLLAVMTLGPLCVAFIAFVALTLDQRLHPVLAGLIVIALSAWLPAALGLIMVDSLFGLGILRAVRRLA